MSTVLDHAEEPDVDPSFDEPPAKPRPSPPVLALFAALALLHAALPFAVRTVFQHAGLSSAQMMVMALHLVGPLAYWPLYRRVELRWLEWGLVLLANHACVLLGALPYLL